MTMTTQDMFDHIVKALLAQNAKSVYPDTAPDEMVYGCAYRGVDGLKCAVGHLIKDEYYDEKFEGVTPPWAPPSRAQHAAGNFDLPTRRLYHALANSIGRGLHEDELHMLLDLQTVHDQLEVSGWPAKFKDIARKYQLEMPD